MTHKPVFAGTSNTRCGRVVSMAALSVIALSLSSQSLSAQPVTGSKGDYKAPAEQKSQGSTAVPKSIYVTPKSDRLAQPTDNNTVQTTDTKSDRQHVSPSDEEPWVEDPEEESIATTDPQDNLGPGNKDNVPEITIPFDPRANKPAKATAPKRHKKLKRKAKARRPIDVAYRNGRLKLNRFHTLKIDMLHHECRDFPNIFLADYKLPRKAIDILSDNMLIVQKRICADNGAVLITCYQNSATISMRRARPDDGCKRK